MQSRPVATPAIEVNAPRFWARSILLAATILAGTVDAQAQQPQPWTLAGHIVVTGEGSVSVPPDHAQIRGGVTTRARTVKEAADANSKLMTGIVAVLADFGIEQKDMQTSRFSIQPVYAPPEPRAEPKLSGYSVSNQVIVTIRQISRVGELLDRLVTAGVTDVGNISFLPSDTSQLLDRARTAAVADARRKAELYASASGVTLGRVAWITEDSGYAPLAPMGMPRAAASAPSVPIASGEDTLQVRITVGFEIPR
jgi:uncharacterized protein YggE